MTVFARLGCLESEVGECLVPDYRSGRVFGSEVIVQSEELGLIGS